MRHTLFILFLQAVLVFQISAQTKTLTLESIFTDKTLYPKFVAGVKPHSTQNWFSFVNDGNTLIKIDPKGQESPLITLDELNKAINANGGESLRSFPEYQWVGENTFSFVAGNKFFHCMSDVKKCVVINEWKAEGKNADQAPVTGYTAYTLGNNLYVSVKGEEKTVTSETSGGIVCGQSVHRNEFGISKGTFWSPKGNKLAFYRMDETMVSEYPLVDITERVGVENSIRYPMAGMKSHQVTVGVYQPSTGTTVFLKTGEPAEQYLTNISWSPDEKYVFIGILNRDQNHLKWNQYDASSGTFVKTLFEETSDRYVEPMTPFVFLPGSNDRFIWQSQRDGFNHLYLFDISGKLIRQLTKGPWMVTEFGGFDAKGESIWFMGTKDSPLESHAYTVNISKANITKISGEAGTHNVQITSDFSLIMDQYSSLTKASSCQLRTSNGKIVKTLIDENNPLKDYVTPVPEIITLTADDGSPLYGRLLKPIHFDATKKYPVFIYVYGGPHTQLVTNSWTGGAGMFQYYLASKGYVVFTLDNRGSANRGLNFESAIFRQCGTVEVADQMTGVNWLKNQPWIDTTRMGVHGWSYGGFMTMSMMLKNPGVFKVGVAGGPVIDWKFYEVMYGERYMDTPESNPNGYENSALTNYADQLDGRLLIIQGYQDGTVVPQHCLSFLEAAIKAGKLVDFFMYPTHEHNVRGKDRLHLYKLIDQFFDDHL